MRILDRNPNHPRVLQHLGWLSHQESSSYQAQERGIEYLQKSLASGMYIGKKKLFYRRL